MEHYTDTIVDGCTIGLACKFAIPAFASAHLSDWEIDKSVRVAIVRDLTIITNQIGILCFVLVVNIVTVDKYVDGIRIIRDISFTKV